MERLPVAASFFDVAATLAMGQNEKNNHLRRVSLRYSEFLKYSGSTFGIY